MKESKEKFYPNFKILKTSEMVYRADGLRDAFNSAKYLQFEGNEIWECKVPEMRVFRLYRVVVNQHLKKDTNIGKVEYPELDEVKIENEDSDYYVRFKQIRYVSSDTDAHPQIIDFRGHLFLHKSPVPGTVLSGTKILDWANTKMINNYEKHAIQYDLDRRNLYTDKVIVDYNNLQTEKISLEIGSKWERVYGDRDTNLFCVEDDGDSVDHWPEVREKGKIVAADEKVVNLFLTYFILLHQNRSLCTDKSTQKKIIRIENQFSMKSYREIPRPVEYLSYNDRISVFFGEAKTSGIGYEIIEIKYIDPEDQAVLNFLQDEFEQKAPDNSTKIYVGSLNTKLKSLKMEELDQNFRRDIHYLLQRPYEVYKKTFMQSIYGVMLEIGQSYSSKDIVSCLLTCEYQPNPEADLKGNHLPEVTILWSTIGYNFPKKLDKAEFKNYLKLLQQHFWTCKCENSSEPELIRIVNILQLEYSIQLSMIYHYEGIKVVKQGSYVIFEETKYVRAKDKSVVKFDHYMKFQEVNPARKALKSITGSISLRLLDEVMKMTKPSSNGISYLIGVKWQDTLPVTNNHSVICEREKAHNYTEDLATDVTQIKGERIIATTVRSLTDFVEQKLWTCKVNEEMKFRRVVNEMLIVDWTKISRIIYFDGITVETVNLPGVDQQALQLTEIKLVAPKTNKIIRYDGQFFIRSNKIVENLFQKSNDMEESGKSTQSKYIPLDVLKFATRKMISDEKSKDEQSSIAKPKGKKSSKNENVGNPLLKGLSYRPKRFKPYSTEILDASGMYFHRIFQVGTSYEEELLADDRSPNTGVEMQCLLDRWNPDKIHNYIPRVSEFIEGEQYLLDRDEFLELFQIESVKVWICMDNKERYLIRVQTSFVGKEPMLAVRYPDGVTIARHGILRTDLSSIPFNTANVTEIIYLDPWSSKVLKYEGDMREIGIPDETTKSDNAAPAPKTKNSR
ncbi:uncharacterized protein LOC111049630 isoform X2 [Nilaparvata lugens]|uniref:uncharacterized protein LOC111049630 isoform X2 n=1 Tax=Nilaparvata lugens TaxID=108931 RepID=UPI00193D55D8|nr:uncharacterized protein LOC111049630 isoform X2 [Nilaparvata lugens]